MYFSKIFLRQAVDKVVGITSSDCKPYVDNFYQCYNHKFNLASCGDDVTDKLIQCQSSTASLVRSKNRRSSRSCPRSRMFFGSILAFMLSVFLDQNL